MQNIIQIECPPELLIGLNMNSETFAELAKMQTAIALFKDGKISSGMAAQWLKIPRTHFLMKAMEHGAELLDDSQDDFNRETSLL